MLSARGGASDDSAGDMCLRIMSLDDPGFNSLADTVST
jgi:hypothetical protein